MADVMIGQKRRDPHDGRVWNVHNIRQVDEQHIVVTLQRGGDGSSIERMPLPKSMAEEMALVEGGS